MGERHAVVRSRRIQKTNFFLDAPVRGQLGHGDQHSQLLPKKVEAFADQCVFAVAAGEHSLALTAEGAVFT